MGAAMQVWARVKRAPEVIGLEAMIAAVTSAAAHGSSPEGDDALLKELMTKEQMVQQGRACLSFHLSVSSPFSAPFSTHLSVHMIPPIHLGVMVAMREMLGKLLAKNTRASRGFGTRALAMCMPANATKLGLMPTLMTMLNTSRRFLYKADAMKASFQKEVDPDGFIKQLDTRPSRKGSITHDALAVVHDWLHTPEASREDNGDKAPMRISVFTGCGDPAKREYVLHWRRSIAATRSELWALF
jgi:hypothetical protein